MKKAKTTEQALALVVTPTLPERQPGAGHAPELRRQSLDYDTNKASDDSGISCPEPTLAQQQFKEESDINFIADRYGLTGELPQIMDLPAYGDFTGIFDFQTAKNAVIAGQQQFMTLPAKLRSRFNNDPQQLLEFLADEDNRKEAEFLGLVKPPEVAPQSPPGNAAAKGDPDTLSEPAKAAAEPNPAGKTGRKGKNTDT